AYRDGELDLEKRGLIEAHVLSCSACQARLDDTSDAEGMLRQGLQDPSDDYFEAMTEYVMERVEGGGHAATAAAPPRPKREPAAAARPAEPEARDARAGRRKSFDDGPRGRAPGLPWPAIIGAASAAAAVVVVVVMLVQRPNAWRSAPAPEVVGLPERSETSAPESEGTMDAAPDAGMSEEKAKESAEGPREDQAPGAKNDLAARAPAAGSSQFEGKLQANGTAQPSKDVAVKVTGGEDEIKTESGAEVFPEAAARQRANRGEPQMSAELRLSKSVAEPGAAAPPSGPGFAEVAGRYGLPLLYDPNRVPGSALVRAEPDLRLLYQTGRAGEDSARVRLYLAEAARERGAGSFDAEAFNTIVHHYRRAVELARDPETSRMARKRLEDFVLRHSPGQ
ncbi:MAG TPA: zf-HC2 domain-containing protein, partial [Candidatus Eisenbacteria bacterium]|nr:zf-HC2 domain-containing protein [Candidatus Eisenbacteria bacterium]